MKLKTKRKLAAFAATLLTIHFSVAEAARQGLQGPAGPRGATGPTGPRGATGAQGPSGALTVLIGETYQGGKVFWVDASGQHGLIVSMSDQGTAPWYSGSYPMSTYAMGDGIYAGKLNTSISIAAQAAAQSASKPINYIDSDAYCFTSGGSGLTCSGGNQFAANDNGFATSIAQRYSVREDGVNPCTATATEVCYGDWYLPSKIEMTLLCASLSSISGSGWSSLSISRYWTSTEASYGSAWGIGLNDENTCVTPGTYYTSGSPTYNIRAIRSF